MNLLDTVNRHPNLLTRHIQIESERCVWCADPVLTSEQKDAVLGQEDVLEEGLPEDAVATDGAAAPINATAPPPPAGICNGDGMHLHLYLHLHLHFHRKPMEVFHTSSTFTPVFVCTVMGHCLAALTVES
jgi:hypothetical protein